MSFEHDRLAHELEVHRLELEVQNGALRDAQIVLEESRARYAELYDYAPVGHLTLDRAGVVRELNIAAAALLGDERGAIAGRPLRLYVTAKSRRALDAHLLASLKSRRPISVALELRRRDADGHPVELLTVPPPVHTRSAVKDVPVLHAAMIDISKHGTNGDSMHQVKQDFLAVVSHELCSPLAPMVMWVEALRAGAMSEALRNRAIDALDTCLALQVAMINDLIDVARGQQGALRIEFEKTDLALAVRAAAEAFSPSASAKKIELTLDVARSPFWVEGDSIRLQQVVANLLSNAIRFTREAGQVVLALHARGANAVLTVRDEGEGIDPAHLPHIFEPFHGRAPLVPPYSGGLGLGLAIVHELVTRHGGSVTAESAGRGRGSCFTVTLPRARTA
jgi:PAS domain S-box-containing protein